MLQAIREVKGTPFRSSEPMYFLQCINPIFLENIKAHWKTISLISLTAKSHISETCFTQTELMWHKDLVWGAQKNSYCEMDSPLPLAFPSPLRLVSCNEKGKLVSHEQIDPILRCISSGSWGSGHILSLSFLWGTAHAITPFRSSIFHLQISSLVFSPISKIVGSLSKQWSKLCYLFSLALCTTLISQH